MHGYRRILPGSLCLAAMLASGCVDMQALPVKRQPPPATQVSATKPRVVESVAAPPELPMRELRLMGFCFAAGTSPVPVPFDPEALLPRTERP